MYRSITAECVITYRYHRAVIVSGRNRCIRATTGIIRKPPCIVAKRNKTKFVHRSNFYHTAFAHTVAIIGMKFSFRLFATTSTTFPMIGTIVMPSCPIVIVSERGYLTAISRGVTPRAVPRLATLRLATGHYLHRIFFFPIVSERRYANRFFLAAHLTQAFLCSFLGAGGCCYRHHFVPCMCGRNNLFFRLATRIASAHFLTVLRTSRRRNYNPISPIVCVFPYRIKRYVGAHLIS